MNTEPSIVPECPRCRYDLRGQIAGWTDSCPVEGRCVECGLDFRWQDTIEGADLPAWSVESTGRAIRSFAGTLLRIAFPPSYWRGMRMEHPLRVNRLAMFAIVCLLVVILSPVLVRAADYATLRLAHSSAGPWTFGSPPIQTYVLSGEEVRLTSLVVANPPTMLRYWLTPVYQPDWVDSNIWVDPMVKLPDTLVFDKMLGIYFLLVNLSTLLAFVALPISRRRARVARRHFVRPLVAALVMPMAIQLLLTVLVFAGLATDVFDAGYWATLPGGQGMFRTPGPYTGWFLEAVNEIRRFADLNMYNIALIGLGLWTLVTWYAICRDFFRMQHAWAVTMSVLAIGFLLPIVLAWLGFNLLSAIQ